MSTYSQANRPLTVTTPLGSDDLLLVGFKGHEGLSQLFKFQLDLLAENKKEIPFDKLLGQKAIVRLAIMDERQRFFSGICNRVSQGRRDANFTSYTMEVVPQFWLLTRRAQSRIFQHISVPEILKKVFAGLDVSFKIQGTFQPRDYCAQYRETDFSFASRLMEEEGIYYFFQHTADGHTMVLANTPQSHPDIPLSGNIIFEHETGDASEAERIFSWQKVQELGSGKYTLWDHCFELPHRHLEAEELIQDSVTVGNVTHKLEVGDNSKLEVYDYPGRYAQRFDGINKGGGEQPAELQKIFQDNRRTVKIRMQQEAASNLVMEGSSNCRHFTSGHKFTLQRHFNADGVYVLTEVSHVAHLAVSDYRSGDSNEFKYENRFTCIPFAIPFRPVRVTPKPTVQGTQTAVVVGPPGEEIFTDKYSRVKVQFHWDREGKNNADSSCWVRVSTLWAGKQWGMIHIPRIGQEVIVDFLEGDPDQPIIVGSVYNADMMPPYTLPANKTQSGIKSRSSMKGGPANFNEFRFEDKKGQEDIYLHAEKNWTIMVENDKNQTVGHDETHTVHHDRTKTVDHDETTTVGHNRTETVGENEVITIGKNRTETVGENERVIITKNRTEMVGVNKNITIGGVETHTTGKNRNVTVGQDMLLNVTKNLTENAGMVLNIHAGVEVNITGPGGSIKIDASGVTIQGVLVKIN